MKLRPQDLLWRPYHRGPPSLTDCPMALFISKVRASVVGVLEDLRQGWIGSIQSATFLVDGRVVGLGGDIVAMFVYGEGGGGVLNSHVINYKNPDTP